MPSTNGISNQFTPAGFTTNPTKASSELDKNGFLMLLTAQMRNQDPSSNQDPSQYFQTLSQMSIVEQLTNLTSQSRVTSAQALLGKTVSYLGSDGVTVTGTVERIALNGDTPRITVAGKDGIDPAILTEIK